VKNVGFAGFFALYAEGHIDGLGLMGGIGLVMRGLRFFFASQRQVKPPRIKDKLKTQSSLPRN
jgi:hypothetical protein